MNKPTTQKPTEEQVQAAKDCAVTYPKFFTLPTERRNAADKLGFVAAIEILAAALEWERWEASEDKARLDHLEKTSWHGGTLTAPDMSGVTHMIQFGTRTPIRARGLRAAIDKARKDA